MSDRRRLLFVSPRFLFPLDSGGKIRTTQVLRGMKGGAFEVTLLSPAPAGAARRHAAELASVCDRFVAWPQGRSGPLARALRWRHLLSGLPFSVAADRTRSGRRAVREALAARPDVAVFDFAHAAVLAPREMAVPCVMFTHNVESEILARQVEVPQGALRKAVWRSQHRKMLRYERAVLERFDRVVAVAERDAAFFTRNFGVDPVDVIPTGVDLEHLGYTAPAGAGRVVFVGSMDWHANIDAIEHFADAIWPAIAERAPEATMTVVGRNPPPALVSRIETRWPRWRFTGFVDDVRPHVRGADVFVIPLRVGGGTRIKGYEAMALGMPIVSTGIGMEGLAAEPGRHFLQADEAGAFASEVVAVLTDADLRRRLSEDARGLVERSFSFRRAAESFERICLKACEGRGGALARGLKDAPAGA